MAKVEGNATKTASKDLKISPTGSESMLFGLEKRKLSGDRTELSHKICLPATCHLP